MHGMNRDDWEFEYTAEDVAKGAERQRAFRLARMRWWKSAKDKVMATIRAEGIEVNESMAAEIANYGNTSMMQPRVSIRADLQQQLAEAHKKVEYHASMVDEYAGWVEVLEQNGKQRIKLTANDWLYFFRETPAVADAEGADA